MNRLAILIAALLLAACATPAAKAQGNNTTSDKAPNQPNVVIVFTDDQGYGDLSCYGNPTIHTPHIDKMAAEGMKLTQFYTSQPLCSPSRASLLTGCYAKRVSMHKHVIFPQYDYGLHTDEHTIADMLKAQGYATGCFGKWHLGHRPGLLPTDQGFDEYFGIPYSNDMSTYHRPGDQKRYKYNLPLLRGDKVLEWEPDQRLLTKRCTQEAVKFIKKNKDKPFFVYMPHAMPHIPLYASKEFRGKSQRGLYGDVIEEIDWSVGQVLKTLKENGIDDNTIVIFASDNGPWLPFKLHGGTAGPLRGGKGTNWEGGQRVPFVIRWPNGTPAGTVCSELTTAMDILPTLAEITGGKLSNKKIDGVSLLRLINGGGGGGKVLPPRDTFLYYTNKGDLAGIRKGDLKLLFAGKEAKGGPFLYNVSEDINESFDLAKKRPDDVKALQALAIKLDAEIEKNARPTRKVDKTLWEWPNINKDRVDP